MPAVLPAPKPSAPFPATDPRPRRWTVAEYHNMGAHELFGDRHVMLIEGVILESHHGNPNEPDPRPWRWNLREYYRLHDLCLFIDQRVSLINGVVYQESPMNPPHETGVSKGTKTLEAVFQPAAYVRVQLPIMLGQASDPHPDLAVVVGTYMTYATQHPTTALLVVEISDTTLAFDQGEKASLYAAGGIADYWIVDLNNRRVEVRRNPIADPSQAYGWTYADVKVLTPGDTISPLALPTATIAVADLLP